MFISAIVLDAADVQLLPRVLFLSSFIHDEGFRHDVDKNKKTVHETKAAPFFGSNVAS